MQRKMVGQMLREWDKKYPGRLETMFTALQNAVPSHLMDASLFDFKNLKTTGVADENGDIVFDEETFPETVGKPFAGVPLVMGQWLYSFPSFAIPYQVPSASFPSSSDVDGLGFLELSAGFLGVTPGFFAASFAVMRFFFIQDFLAFASNLLPAPPIPSDKSTTFPGN